jgi:uncharacterized membrane protein YidH (DUF202 family)
MEQNVKEEEDITNALVGEIQIILAEKRTSLAFMRTGIAVFALPLSVLSALIATSRYYEFASVKNLLIPLLILCAVLIVLGSYLIVRSVVRVHRYDNMIVRIKRQHSVLKDVLD